ncbi:MAG: hypothetical protein AAFO81_01385 [Pseudomonadota bacterium]
MRSTQTLVALICMVCSAACADTVTRFYPTDLQQDGRVTLTPSFSPDGRTLYFAQSECTPIWECPQRLKTATRTDAGWSNPALVPLPAEGRADWPFVTADGNTLIFSWSAPRDAYAGLDIVENFDLYTLDLTQSDAVPIAIAGGDINRPRAGSLRTLRFMHNETLPSLTRDGTLYFMTERPDGIGERDIYSTQRNHDGSFGIATPLPAPINSAGRDDGVWVSPDGSVMLLCYLADNGSSDLYVAFRDGDNWSVPLRLGDEINTTAAEFGARLTPDNKTLLFTSDRAFDNQPRGLLQVWSASFDLERVKLRALR